MNPCKVCGKPGTVCSADVRDDAGAVEFYCEGHAAAELGAAPASGGNTLEGLVKTLRLIIGFGRTNDRLPTTEEVSRMGGVAAINPARLSPASLPHQLSYLEHIASYVETRGHFPPPEDLPPDPFL